MAKGQISEQDLKQGIQSLGGFGALATAGPKRDSPFGSDFVKHTGRIAPEVLPSSSAPSETTPPDNLKEIEGRGGVEARHSEHKASDAPKPLKGVRRVLPEAKQARAAK